MKKMVRIAVISGLVVLFVLIFLVFSPLLFKEKIVSYIALAALLLMHQWTSAYESAHTWGALVWLKHAYFLLLPLVFSWHLLRERESDSS